MSQSHDSALLEEYKSLRAEIQSSSQVRLLIISFSTSAWTGIAAWIVANRIYFTATVALTVLHAPIVLSYALLLLADRHIMRVSTYIREFIEPQLAGLAWETRVAQFQAGSPFVLSLTQIGAIALLLLSSGSLVLERSLGLSQDSVWLLILLPLAWLFFCLFHFRLLLFRGSRGYERTASEIWRRMKIADQTAAQPESTPTVAE